MKRRLVCQILIVCLEKAKWSFTTAVNVITFT